MRCLSGRCERLTCCWYVHVNTGALSLHSNSPCKATLSSQSIMHLLYICWPAHASTCITASFVLLHQNDHLSCVCHHRFWPAHTVCVCAEPRPYQFSTFSLQWRRNTSARWFEQIHRAKAQAGYASNKGRPEHQVSFEFKQTITLA